MSSNNLMFDGRAGPAGLNLSEITPASRVPPRDFNKRRRRDPFSRDDRR